MPPDLLAELARDRQRRRGQAGQRRRAAGRSTGLDVLAGNDDVFLRTLEIGGTGGILVASHLVGPEMRDDLRRGAGRRRSTRAREIDAELRPIYEALTVTTQPDPGQGGAARCSGICSARLRLPMVEADDEQRAAVRAALEAPRPAGGERRVGLTRAPRSDPPARRAGRDRQEHDRRRVRRPDRRRRHRADVPDRRDARHRPRAARLLLPARARRRHRGDRPHPRPRGPRRRAALRAARDRHAAGDLRRPADDRRWCARSSRSTSSATSPLEDARAPASGSRPGPFEVELVHMSHSIPDACAVALHTRRSARC